MKLSPEQISYNKLIRAEETKARRIIRKRLDTAVNASYKKKYGRKKRSDAGKKRK